MSLVHNLVARFRADTGTFDRNIKKSRDHMTRFGKDMQRVSRQLLAFGGGYILLNRGVKGAVRAFMEQEKAERSLMAATNQSIGSFKKFASEIQKATIYGDELILSQMAYAKNLGVTTDQLEAATTAAVGLAAKYRLDLATSMMLVGRASQGQTQMLTRYGIVLSESLTAQEKFNAVLKIGAEAFHLAEADTETLEGAWTQFKNAAGDFSETIVGAWVDVARGMDDVIDHYKGLEKSAESAEEVMVRIKKNMPTFQTNMPGMFYYPPPSKPKSKVGPLTEEQEFDRWAKKQRVKMDSVSKQIEEQTKQRSDAELISRRYLDNIDKEIQLTGLVGDARQHAAKAIEMENKLKEAGVLGTIAGTEQVEKLGVELTKLAKVQKLERIAQDIGSAFADAFTDMIFEAKRFGDVMKSLMRDIARSVVKNMITTPIAQGITGAISDMFPATVSHSGGMAGIGGKRNVPAMAFAGAPRLHNGLMADEFPTILQRGEQVIPKGGGGGLSITFINESGTPLKQKGEPFFNGKELVVGIVAEDIQRGGQLRDLLKGA